MSPVNDTLFKKSGVIGRGRIFVLFCLARDGGQMVCSMKKKWGVIAFRNALGRAAGF